MLGIDATALHDTDLAAVTSEEEPGGPEPESVNPTITDSFQGFRGIAQVTQASGNLNSLRNVLSVSVISVAGAQP